MKKTLFTSLLFLFLTNLFAQNSQLSGSNLGKSPNAAGDFKLTVVHGGNDGAKIKSSIGFSAVDIDAANGDAALRFARSGSLLWLAGNNNFGLGIDDFAISEFNVSPRLTIKKTTGNVGIGTTNPSSRFEINQPSANTDLRISADCGFCSTRLSFISDKATGGWRPGYIASGDHGTFTGRLDFFTNGTGGANQYGNELGMSLMNKRLTIGGGFASTNPYSVELHSSGSYGFANYNSNFTSKWEQYSNSSGNLELFANDSYRGVFNGTTGVYTSVSDRSFKNNIAPLNSILDKVLSLQTSTYEYKDNNPNNRKSIGLIAQDVEALFPEFVYKNLLERSGKEIYTMDYAGLSVIALKAIQEQQIMIKELQAEILKLKK